VYVNGQHSWIAILVFAAALILRLATSRRRRNPHPRNPSAGSGFTSSSTSPSTSPTTGSAGSSFTGTAPGWFTDPFVRHEQRYWSGTAWTEHVMDSGTPAVDPPPPPASPSASAA
jgi:hypothetical protein